MGYASSPEVVISPDEYSAYISWLSCLTSLDIRLRLRCDGDVEDVLPEPVRPGPGDDVMLGTPAVNGVNFDISTSSPASSYLIVLDVVLTLRKSVAADAATAAAAAFDFVTNADNTSDVFDVFDSSSMSAAADGDADGNAADGDADAADGDACVRTLCMLWRFRKFLAHPLDAVKIYTFSLPRGGGSSASGTW